MTAEAWLRRFLFGAAAATYLGAVVELALVEHWGGFWQVVPFALCGLGLAAVAWAWRRPGARSLRAVLVTSALAAVGAGVGVVQHARGNALFALDIRPGLTVGETVLESLSGGNPLLAPGLVALAAALGAAATHRHGAWGRQRGGAAARRTVREP